MVKALEYILTRFPGHGAKIMDLYGKDDDFRILCEDYLTSIEALDGFKADTVIKSGYEMDFYQVYIELEKEIQHALETHP